MAEIRLCRKENLSVDSITSITGDDFLVQKKRNVAKNRDRQ